MANRKTGAEDLDAPFKARRHSPGTNAGQHITGTSAASWHFFQHAKTLRQAAKIARNKYGLPPLLLDMILYPAKYGQHERRNNVKLMNLVRLCKNQLHTRRKFRNRTLCTEVARRI